ncbi:Carboxypeptidase A2 [Folsomia candida]|uniref:Carboxypeptidase A2 n=1 Tax=Folsomia candida TaxID=158441 RepID=A0A226EVI2_FOLCA|nr:Carboxypeptidase A2 [Folsomia candida]
MEPISISGAGLTSPAFFPTFACLFATFRNGIRSYEGYKVFRVNATNTATFEALKNVYHQEEFDFWSPPSMVSPTDILVPPQQISSIGAFFSLVGAKYEIINENVQFDVDFEQLNYIVRQERASMSWNAYHRFETIQSWMESMAQQYPALVTIFTVGNSTENRPLKVMKISTGGAGSQKPAIWLDGGIHAREWVAPATVSFIANELITQTVRKRQTRYIEAFDWYFDPMMNPDGYEYTHQFDRLWRKTRSGGKPILGGLFGCCKGTDPNRNWDHKWGGKGTSKNQCSQIYHGPSPASEPEVKAIQDFILDRKDQIKLFLTFHSYSQLLLLPWGYDNVRTDDHDELMRVGDKALKALEKVHGTKYEGGATPELLYPAAGGSHDWAKAVANIKFAYCYELRDKGRHGFTLPANQIVPTGEETFAAVKSMADDMIDFYNISIPTTPSEGNRIFETYTTG